MVVDYADQSTKELLFPRKERTFALIKPDAYSNIGKIIDIIIANGFQINRAQMLRLNEREHGLYAVQWRHVVTVGTKMLTTNNFLSDSRKCYQFETSHHCAACGPCSQDDEA
jgi:nucleoside diphosphate kinase